MNLGSLFLYFLFVKVSWLLHADKIPPNFGVIFRLHCFFREKI